MPHTINMTVSNEQIVRGSTERPEGFLQFEVGEKLAHNVLGRVMSERGLDMMRRRQGGFFVTVSRPLPYILNGLLTERKEGEQTFGERTQRVPRQSLAYWPRAVGPEIVKLAALYPREKHNGRLSHVALAMIPDDASYQSIARIAGGTSALLTSNEHMKLDLIPKLTIPIGFLAVKDTASDDYLDRLVALQREVGEYNQQDDAGVNRLKVPARFFAPAQQRARG